MRVRGLYVKANCLRIIKNLTKFLQFIYDKKGLQSVIKIADSFMLKKTVRTLQLCVRLRDARREAEFMWGHAFGMFLPIGCSISNSVGTLTIGWQMPEVLSLHFLL